MKFDGREFARKIIDKLKKLEIINKKLVVFYNPEDKASRVYTSVKERVAQELGVNFVKVPVSEIKDFSNYEDADGILFQMPLGVDNEQELINLIDPKKDVDGLREDSLFLPAAVRAVQKVLSAQCPVLRDKKIYIVGASGFVGRKLMKAFGVRYSVFGMDKDNFDPKKLKTADVIISTTGQKEIIGGGMVKQGFVAIDVGYPEAGFTPEALAKASFYTPVPGGVGPVTVAMLFANLNEATGKSL